MAVPSHQHRDWVAATRLTNATKTLDPKVDIGSQLHQGEFIDSPDRHSHLVLQKDGRLRIFQGWLWTPEYCLWESPAAGDAGEGPFFLDLAADGTLSIYRRGATNPGCIWTATIGGCRPAELRFDPATAFLGLYLDSDASSAPLWGFPSLPPVVPPTVTASFERDVVPLLAHVVEATNVLVDALCSGGSAAAADAQAARDAFTAYGFVLEALLESAVAANQAILAQLEAVQAALLVNRRQLGDARETLQTTAAGDAQRRAKLAELVAQQQQQVRDAQEQERKAREEYEHARKERDRKQREADEKRKLACAFAWLPWVAIGLAIAASVDSTEVNNWKYAMDARQREVGALQAHVAESTLRLDALKCEENHASNDVRTCNARIAGTEADLASAKRDSAAAGDLYAMVRDGGFKINKAFGTAKVLCLQSAGSYTSIATLANTIDVFIKNLCALPGFAGSDRTVDLAKKSAILKGRAQALAGAASADSAGAGYDTPQLQQPQKIPAAPSKAPQPAYDDAFFM